MAILAIQNPVFKPAMRIISSITNANPALVTTTFNHNYMTGLIVRLIIPPGFGMQEVNEQQGTITVVSDTTFTIDLDTTEMSVFSAPSSYPEDQQYAQVVPIGEDNSILTQAVQNVLPY